MIENYINYLRYKNFISLFEDKFTNESILSLYLFLSNNLNKLEKQIFIQHYLNGRTLKTISNSTNFSYSHIQGTNIRLKSKIDIAINFLVTNEINNISNLKNFDEIPMDFLEKDYFF